MPITPFHLGPGLLAKAASPTHFSFTAYTASQLVIDTESIYHILHGDWPVHRSLHTFFWGTLVGCGVAVLVAVVGALWSRARGQAAPRELALACALAGGAIGGASHSFLDGIMHSDIEPFQPFAGGNPLHALIGLGVLHLGCVAAGVLGLLWLGARRNAKVGSRSV